MVLYDQTPDMMTCVALQAQVHMPSAPSPASYKQTQQGQLNHQPPPQAYQPQDTYSSNMQRALVRLILPAVTDINECVGMLKSVIACCTKSVEACK